MYRDVQGGYLATAGPDGQNATPEREERMVVQTPKLITKVFKTIPSDPLKAHPGHKYPKFVQALNTVPQVLKAPTDLQKGMSFPEASLLYCCEVQPCLSGRCGEVVKGLSSASWRAGWFERCGDGPDPVSMRGIQPLEIDALASYSAGSASTDSKLTLQLCRLYPSPASDQCSPRSTLKSLASRWDPRAHKRLMRRDTKVYVMPFDGKLEQFFLGIWARAEQDVELTTAGRRC